jgi:DNA-binding response OmpR family regulator
MKSMDVRVVKQSIYRLRKQFMDYSVGYSIEHKRGQGYRFVEC